MQLFKYFFASSACVTLRREFLSCQFQFSLRTSMKIELILAKSACFTTPVNIQEMTICPLHRERLGIRSVQNADCRLQTGYKMQTRYKMQTADCRLSTKCRLLRKTFFYVRNVSTFDFLTYLFQ